MALIDFAPAHSVFVNFELVQTKLTSVPDGPDWLHEVKYDGHRLGLERDGDRRKAVHSCEQRLL
jgi:ATP-dependent DNA ligase